MTVDEPPPETSQRRRRPRQRAGVLLARGREAAGLSVEGIAQQLKLAPRQIRALEEGDFAAPARTHVRARLRAQLRAAGPSRSAGGARRAAGRWADLRSTRPPLAPTRADGRDPGRTCVAAAWHPLGDSAGAVRDRRRRRGLRTLSSAGGAAHRAAAPATAADARAPMRRRAAPAIHAALVGAACAKPAPRPPVDDRRTPAPGTLSTPAPNRHAATGGAARQPMRRQPRHRRRPRPAQPRPARRACRSARMHCQAAAGAAACRRGGRASLVLTFQGVSWVEVKDDKGATLLNMTGSPGRRRPCAPRHPSTSRVGNAARRRRHASAASRSTSAPTPARTSRG